MLSSLELRDILQAATTLIAALSVFIAIATYRKSRITQQITELRAALGESLRRAEALDFILSERYTTKIGLAISDEIKHLFGEDISIDRLGEYFGDKAYHDLLIGALYSGVDKSNVFEEIEGIRDSFSDLQVKLRSLAPLTARLFSMAHEYMASLVMSAFHVGNIKNQFEMDAPRNATILSFKKMPTTRLAYADLADSFSSPSAHFIRSTVQRHFDRIHEIISTISNKLMVMSDQELIRYFNADKRISPPSVDDETVPAVIASLAACIESARPLLNQKEQDTLLRAISQIEALQQAK